MKIREVMNRAVCACQASDSLNHAAQLMWNGDLGCLPVVDETMNVVGMITDRDLAMAAHLRGAPLWAIEVGDAMAKLVFSAKETDSLRTASELMSRHQLRRLPVVDADGKLSGILTLGALACASAAKSKKALNAKQVGAILASISAPRPPAPSDTMVVEVTRADADESTKNVIQPAPRKSKKSAPKAASASKPKPKTKPKSKSGK